jgi:hypothetical protein
MAGIFTKMGIGVSVLAFFLFITSWAMAEIGAGYGVTVEDLYNENSPDLRVDANSITVESLGINQESSLDQASTDAAQAQGDISANKNNAGMFTILQTALGNLNNILPYHWSINLFIGGLMTILIIMGGLYIITGRKG